MRFVRKLWVLVGALLTLAVAPSAQAAIPSVFNGEAAGGAGIACVPQEGVRFCEGSSPGNELPPGPDTRVPGVGGVPIDVNVALPAEPPSGNDGNYPLLMMFHGYGGHKLDFGDMKRFAERGYAVFSMSDRGFGDSCGSPGSRLTAACAQGWVRLLDTRYEVGDAQLFAGILADEGIADPQRIGATGGSYGGGLSMALAALRDRVMKEDGTLSPWTSPGGKPMRIAAAAPEIPWTDLAYALTPNGGTLDFVADSSYDVEHAGISKQSFVAALYGAGQATGYYAPPLADPDADLTTWFTRINAGEPYEGDPVIEDALEELQSHHSSYYIDHSQPPAPLLISNGWTDDLFPPDEAIRFYNRTNSEHPDADISLFFLDYGHMRGQNKGADIAKLKAAQDAFLDHYLLGVGAEPEESVTAITQTCPKESASAGPFTAPNWQELSPGELRFVGDEEQTIAPAAGGVDTNQAFDPVAGSGACATASGDDQQGAATYRLGEAKGGGFTLAGSPTVIADIETQSPTSQVAARLLDVSPEGERVARRPRPLPARHRARGGRCPPSLPAPRKRLEVRERAHRQARAAAERHPYGRISNGQAPVTVANLDLRLPTLDKPGGGGGAVVEPGGVGGSSTGTIDGPLPSVIPDGSAPAPEVTAAGPCESGLTEKGTKRNDSSSARAGGDRLRGGKGNDKVSGKDGDDCLNGGKGKDRVSGGDGDDPVRARDGEKDRVSCGKGEDKVTADKSDKLRGCEQKKR